MRKVVFSVIILFISCDQSATKTQTVNERKLESFCDSFIVSHKNWNQNDIINEAANDDLQKSLSTEISDGLFSDFPIKLYLINEYKPGKYAAHFSTDYKVKTKYDIDFDVIALISKKEGLKLKTDSLYGLKGHFKKFLRDDFQNYSYGMANSPKVQIKHDDVYEDSAAFDLGIILMDSLEINRLN